MGGPLKALQGLLDPTKFNKKTTAEEVTAGLDLTGKTIIVTGGASGIGQETTRVLAKRGADVIMAVRNVGAGEKVKREIEEEGERESEGGSTAAAAVGGAAASTSAAKYGRVSVMELDLASKASVRNFAAKFKALSRPLHVLINNAGVMETPFSLTKDGTELQFATNHLGHFLLTNLLLPKLKESAGQGPENESRIVNLSSLRHHQTYPEGIRFEKLNSPDGYSPLLAYGQSKLANVLHANELARRLKAEGANVTANSVHPGIIYTPLFRHFVPNGSIKRALFDGVYYAWLQFVFKTVPQGAATTCLAAVHPSVKGISGKYFDDCQIKATSKFGQDEALATKLWEVSESMTKDDEGTE